MKKLNRDFYNRDTLIVAEALVGKILVHETAKYRLKSRIVEVEAYKGPMDKAAHSYANRRTKRTEIMFGPPGYAYIFLIYGMYHCMNIVTEREGNPCAVLIRAVEPLNELEYIAQIRFKKSYEQLRKTQKIQLSNGPGKVCLAMNINMDNYGDDLCNSNLYICEDDQKCNFTIGTSKRINIDYAEEAIDFPWRYYIEGNPYVSV